MAVQFQYTNRDFSSIKDEMVSKIPSLADDWTNLNEGDLGMVLVNLIAGVADMLSYYTDRAVEEVFLPTAFTREAMQRLTRLIDYRLSRPKAAVTTLRFSLPDAADANISIPRFTQCKTKDGLYFVTKTDATLYAGNTYVDVLAYQGKYVRDEFTGTGDLLQTFGLSRPRVAQNFLLVEVSGTEWVEDTPDTSLDLTAVYEVNSDGNDVATLRFSGNLGSIPQQNSTIIVHYLETDGGEGNIGTDKVTEIVSSIVGGSALEVTNTVQATGGSARESIEQARIAAPRRFRTLGRAVTLQDHVDIAESASGVAKAQAINHKGYVEMYVAPEGGGPLFLSLPEFTAVKGADANSTLSPGTYFIRVTAVDENGAETADWEYEHTPSGSGDPDDDTREVVINEKSVAVIAGEAIALNIMNVEGATAYRAYIGTVTGDVAFVKEAVADPDGVTYIGILSEPVAGAATPPSVNTTGARADDGVSSLKNEIEEELETKRLVGAIFALYNPVYVDVNVEATVHVWDNYKQSDVQGRVETALAEMFDFENRDFASDVSVAEVYKTIMEVEGVRSVTNLVSPAGDFVAIGNGELARLGTVTLMMSGGIQ